MDPSQTMEEEPQPGPSRECSNENVEKKRKNRIKRNEPYKMATHLQDFSLDWGKMLDEMKCSICHLLPNPEWRYLCSKGHQFCQDCFDKEELCPVTVIEMDETQGISMYFPNFTTKVKRCCKAEIRQYPPDALYTAFLTNFTFKCPNACGECLPGSEVHSHFAKCQQRR